MSIDDAIHNYKDYIGSQTLANTIELVASLDQNKATEIALDDSTKTYLQIDKI